MAESKNFIQIKADNSFIQEYGDFKDDVKRLSRHDKGIVAPGAAVAIKDDNKVTLTTDNSQLKLSPQGHLDMIALQSTARVNREYIKTDEIVLNNHKFNNKKSFFRYCNCAHKIFNIRECFSKLPAAVLL